MQIDDNADYRRVPRNWLQRFLCSLFSYEWRFIRRMLGGAWTQVVYISCNVHDELELHVHWLPGVYEQDDGEDPDTSRIIYITEIQKYENWPIR